MSDSVNCPCCGYPTLSARAAYEICILCNWEDDGQDERDADDIRGGPNGGYSLSAARENFRRYLVMYPPPQDPRIGGADSPLEIQSKQALMALFDSRANNSSAQLADYQKHLKRLKQILWQETKRKIRIYEKGLTGG